jgi:hypothetical protein
MTIEARSSNSWTEFENDILSQCGDAWKKGNRVDWKNHKITLNRLFPQRSLSECKRQYHFIQHIAHYSGSFQGGVTKSLKQRVRPCPLQIEEPLTYSQPIKNLSPTFLIKTPIGSQIKIYSHSPFAHPPLFEVPLQPSICLLSSTPEQDLLSVQSYDSFDQYYPSSRCPSDCSMRSTPLLDDESITKSHGSGSFLDSSNEKANSSSLVQSSNSKPATDEFSEFSSFFDNISKSL